MGDLIGMGGSLLAGMGIGWLLTEGALLAAAAVLEVGTAGLATPLVLAIGVGVAATMQA